MTTQTTTIKPGTPVVGRTPAPARTRTDAPPDAPRIKPGAMDGDAPGAPSIARDKPTHAQVERRAYEIWLRRGGGDGSAAVDWLQAERELQVGSDPRA